MLVIYGGLGMTSKEIDTLFDSVKIDSGYDVRVLTGRLLQNFALPKDTKDLIEDVIAEAFILGYKRGKNERV